MKVGETEKGGRGQKVLSTRSTRQQRKKTEICRLAKLLVEPLVRAPHGFPRVRHLALGDREHDGRQELQQGRWSGLQQGLQPALEQLG